MDPGSKDVEEVILPDKPPKGSSKEHSKPPNPPANKKKEKKRKKPIYKPRKLLASLLWIAAIATFAVGGIGLVNLILSLYLKGGPDWNYVLIITNLGRDVQMIVYGFEGHKRDTNIRMKRNITFPGNFDVSGVNDKFKLYFKEAEEMIPRLSRSSSPVIFAGAGDMRLLRSYYKGEYDNIMRDLNQLFKKSSLKVLPNSVRTLEDWEEALHGWVTLNYLSDNMIKGRQPIKSKRDIFTTRKTFGLFDLGPTSLHFSYEVPRVLDNTKLPAGVRVITLYGRVYYVYTQTFPCSGAVRMVDKFYAYRYDEKERTGPGGKIFRNYDDTIYGQFAHSYCFYTTRSDYQLMKENRFNATTRTTQLVNKEYPLRTVDVGFPMTGPYTFLPLHYILRPCSARKEIVKKLQPRYKYIYYSGKHDPAVCKEEVEEMMNKCSQYFTYQNECPVFKIPKRPYNVTFIMSNELAVYAQLAGIKSGDPKTIWKKKREDICKMKHLNDVKKKYPSKTPDRFRHVNLCLVITYLEYVLNKLNLNKTEWSNIRFQEDIGENRVAWQLGYAINATNALPTSSPFHDVFTLEDIFIQGLVYAGILTFSSLVLSFALRNSDTLATRPLKIPQ